MQKEIADHYRKHLIDAKQTLEKSHKMREDYVLSCVKKIDANKIKKKILLTTTDGFSALKIFSVPTRKQKWFSTENLWTISSRHTLSTILDKNGVLAQLRHLFEIPELNIYVKHSELVGHEYYEYDVIISWPLYVDKDENCEESSSKYFEYISYEYSDDSSYQHSAQSE